MRSDEEKWRFGEWTRCSSHFLETGIRIKGDRSSSPIQRREIWYFELISHCSRGTSIRFFVEWRPACETGFLVDEDPTDFRAFSLYLLQLSLLSCGCFCSRVYNTRVCVCVCVCVRVSWKRMQFSNGFRMLLDTYFNASIMIRVNNNVCGNKIGGVCVWTTWIDDVVFRGGG